MAAAPAALQKDVQHFDAESAFFKEIIDELMVKTHFVSQSNCGKKLYRLSAIIFNRPFSFFLKVKQGLTFRLAREISERCTDGDAPVRNWYSRGRQS